MKRNIFIVIAILVLLGGAGMVLFGKIIREVKISDIKSFHYSYSTGTMMNAYVTYDITIEDEKYYLEVKLNNEPEEDKKKIKMTNDDMDELNEILTKNHVGRWDGFKKSDPYVLDGNSFSLFVHFTNGDGISASGYMMYPNNYNEVRSELENLFMSIYERN